jgi:hypothetical protein
MDTRKRCFVAVIASVLIVVPATALGQTAAPAPCATDPLTASTDTLSGAATTVSKDTTTLASAGTQLSTAEQKFNGMLSSWKKPKTTTTPTAKTPTATTTTTVTNTTPAKLTQVSSAANSAGTTNKAPCKPSGPAPAGAAGAKLTANGQPASPSAATKPAAGAEVAGTSRTPTFTLMPDGDYMVGYAGTGAGAQTTYAKVKQISPSATPSAANPRDGVYTDGKAYYMVTNGKLTVTPIGGVANK